MKGEKATRYGIQMITSSISTTLVLLLVGLVTLSVLTARGLSVYVKENIVLSILISDDMKEQDILGLQQRLDAQPFTRQTTYISKQQALEEHTQAMGTDPTEFLGYNPFSASIEVKLHAVYANSDSIAVIEQRVKQNTNVQDLLYQKDLIDAVNDNVRRISLFLLAMAALLCLISFALINNTIRLSVYSERFLIHTMKLVGASWSFIRRPLLRRGMTMGLVAGVLASALLWAGAGWLVDWEPELRGVITPVVMAWVTAVCILMGLLITWLCGLLSVNKFLRMKAGELYYA